MKNDKTKGKKKESSKKKKKTEKQRKNERQHLYTLKQKLKEERKEVWNEERKQRKKSQESHTSISNLNSGIAWRYFCAAQNYLQVNAKFSIVVHK